jgi:hypothetical protein
MEPGIYTKLPSDDYHGDLGSYSKSSLVDFDLYPKNMIYQRLAERTPKNNQKFDMGSAAHTAVLEPEKIERDIAVCPDELLGKNGARSTKAYKEWAASQPTNVALLTTKQWDSIRAIRDSIHENPNHSKAKNFLTGGLPEVSCFWEEQFHGDEVDPDSGYHKMIPYQYGEASDDTHKIMVKCRPDYLPYNGVAVDLKTTATPIDKEGFTRQAYNLHYHWSAALTLRGLTTATTKQHRIYVFVVVEINPPHEVAVYRATEDFVALGKMQVMSAMSRLSWCDKNNHWPGMPDRIQQVGLPGYVLNKLKFMEG